MPTVGRERIGVARLCPALFTLLACLLTTSPVQASELGQDGAALIAADLRGGVIDAGTALLQMFRWTYAPHLCLPEYRDAKRGPIRCLQPHVAQFNNLRAELDTKAAEEICGYLEPGRAATKSGISYVSPLGYFELHYETSGPDSVPSEDINPPNGTPDFVERCAEYADNSWVTELGLGFVAPELPSDGTYDIGFQNLGVGVYGFADTSGTTTAMVLHSTFQGGGWPPNNDPDGEPLGRAKATIAHELRHASQFTNNGWTEGLWAELDAAWVEEVVFPDTDDYINFLDNWSFSQLDSPWTSLDNDSGEGNYADCLWQHYLSQTYGNQIIVDLWDNRALLPTIPMVQAFEDVMDTYSTSWDESYPLYLEWCWFTSFRSTPLLGFPDAPLFWLMEFVESPIGVFPFSTSDNVDAISGHPRRFNKALAFGTPRIVFDGEDSTSALTVSVLMPEPDGSLTIVRPTLGPGNSFDYIVPLPFHSLRYLGVIVTNTDQSGQALEYSLQVVDDETTDVPTITNGPQTYARLEPPVPNPSQRSTRLSWSLPRPNAVTLRILDVSGRAVRTLQRRVHSTEHGETTWDGRADTGRLAPAGVYWAVLDSGRETSVQRIVRLR